MTTHLRERPERPARGDVRLTGTVKWFDGKKGFGFIERDDGGEDLFVHYSEVDGKGWRALNEGDRVEFCEGPGKKGMKAVRVTVVNTES